MLGSVDEYIIAICSTDLAKLAGGGGLAVEHAELVVDAVGGGGGGGGGRAEVVRLRGLLLGGGDVAQHAVDRRHLQAAEERTVRLNATWNSTFEVEYSHVIWIK